MCLLLRARSTSPPCLRQSQDWVLCTAGPSTCRARWARNRDADRTTCPRCIGTSARRWCNCPCRTASKRKQRSTAALKLRRMRPCSRSPCTKTPRPHRFSLPRLHRSRRPRQPRRLESGSHCTLRPGQHKAPHLGSSTAGVRKAWRSCLPCAQLQ